ALVGRLEDAGVRTSEPESSAGALPFQGMQFVLTGSLETMTRDEARAEIELRGGRVTSSVSKKTSAVVVGAEPGAKYDRARELGVACLDEAEFRRRLASG
ncbi:MAG TPA: BRCT domain-containing protein, partial [Vicinamibacteria bacterium]